jgi:hypothetical protein
MTTIAFDGKTLAADMLAVDNWGLKDYVSKLMKGKDFVAGGAGERSQILQWWKEVEHMHFDDVLKFGYPMYDKEKNDPSILIAPRFGGVYKHMGGLIVPCSRIYHACGSGRDFALTAMHLGKSAKEAVEIASMFDNNTGGATEVLEAKQ